MRRPLRVCCIGRARQRRSVLVEEAGPVRRPRPVRACLERSAFAGFRFPAEVITVVVRWYLCYGLSYRDVEELLAERGVEVDHVTVYRWGSGSPRCSPTPPDRSGTPPATAGSWTRPTSRWPAAGGTCTGRSTSTARSSTCCCPSTGILRRPAGSSPAPCGVGRRRSR